VRVSCAHGRLIDCPAVPRTLPVTVTALAELSSFSTPIVAPSACPVGRVMVFAPPLASTGLCFPGTSAPEAVTVAATDSTKAALCAAVKALTPPATSANLRGERITRTGGESNSAHAPRRAARGVCSDVDTAQWCRPYSTS
jgi:hypothetical protein